MFQFPWYYTIFNCFPFLWNLVFKVYTGLFACFYMMCICLTLWCLPCFVYMWWSGGSVCRILSSPFKMFCLSLSGWNYLELFNKTNKTKHFSFWKTFFAICLHNCYFYAKLCHCNAILAFIALYLWRHVTSLQLANCFNIYGGILLSIPFLIFGNLLVLVYSGLFA